MDNSRYDILFEPVQIGPVTAPNRFYQVPHCNGMGHTMPRSLATMRGIKAEGGWGSVCTEVVEIHPTSDLSPFHEGRLWDDHDIPPLKLMTEEVHKHGSLAGIELGHFGALASNLYSRMPSIAPSPGAECTELPGHPFKGREMSLEDIQLFRQWHKDAAIRAKKAGFDIIYVYAGHNLNLLSHFISRRHNRRTDEYGGSLENRVRLLREVLEDTKEAVGDTCAVALRFAVEELLGDDGISCEKEGRAIVEMLADLPDLWDVNIAGWHNDSITSRFSKEGHQEDYIRFVKQVTGKPVVGVGRYTSADRMVSLVKNGVIDLIGAARPSIADPFLPNKIQQGLFDEIRECIGCNICVMSDHNSVPIRCTQNPTMGEEYRRGWHPERMPEKKSDETVLVVGAGPAGLEFTQVMSKRGYNVVLAEGTAHLGGRVAKEAQLPGLSEWIRVLDYREMYIKQAANIEVYRDSQLTAEDILSFGISHVYLATGAMWRRDGISFNSSFPIAGLETSQVLTPDDIMAGQLPTAGKKVVVYDDDHYYMAGTIAEKLAKEGFEVTYVTPAPEVSKWCENTMDSFRVHAALAELGVDIVLSHALAEVEQTQLNLSCSYTGQTKQITCDSLVLVTGQIPNDSLYKKLKSQPEVLKEAGIETLEIIGDGLAPGIIASAVHSGHLHAREFGEEKNTGVPFKRELIDLTPME